jgi:hypothetical protein
LVQGGEDAAVHACGGFAVSETGEYAIDGIHSVIRVGVGVVHLCASFLKPLAEAGACAEEQGSHGRFGFAEDDGDLGGAEFFDRGEQEDVVFGAGQALHLAEYAADALGFVKGLMRCCAAGGKVVGEVLVELLRADSAATVDGEVPCDAREPDAHVAYVGEAIAVFEDANKGVLHDVFGLGGAAKDGVGDAEEEARVCLDEGGEVDLGLCALGERQRQA